MNVVLDSCDISKVGQPRSYHVQPMMLVRLALRLELRRHDLPPMTLWDHALFMGCVGTVVKVLRANKPYARETNSKTRCQLL